MMDSLVNNTILNLTRNSRNNQNFFFLQPSSAFDIYDKKNYTDKYAQVRLFGPTLPYHYHTCEIIKRDTGVKKYFQMPCIAYNPKTGQYIENHDCPLCKAGIKSLQRFYVNAIIRNLENTDMPKPYSRTPSETKPIKIGGVPFIMRSYEEGKDDNGRPKIVYSNSFSPVRVLELSSSVLYAIAEMEKVNLVKHANGERKLTSVTDLDYGCDLMISYRPSETTPAKKYTIQRTADGITPITKEMRKEDILMYDLSILPDFDPEVVKKEFIRSCSRIVNITNKDYVTSLLQDNCIDLKALPSNVTVNTISLSQIKVDNSALPPASDAIDVQVIPQNNAPSLSAPTKPVSISDFDDEIDDEFNDLK